MTCGSNGCGKPASGVVYWPGQTTPMCDEHTARARNVATAMGFVVTVVPVARSPEDKTE